MTFPSRSGILVLFSVLVLASADLWSQIPVERSSEKIVVSGVRYYVHQVRKGQTVYSIARAYGVTVDDLVRENPRTANGIKEGQILRIPVKSAEEKPENTSLVKKDNSHFMYHTLKAGETVYSVSKLYGVTDKDIIQSNPGININKLSVGMEIAVPKKSPFADKQPAAEQKSPSTKEPVKQDLRQNQQDVQPAEQKGETQIQPRQSGQEKKYVFHKVEKGETLTSIAQQYGTTVRVLRKENNNIRFPQVGDYIRVPYTPQVETVTVKTVEQDTAVKKTDEHPAELKKPTELTRIEGLKGSIDVGVLLPFYTNENERRIEIDSSKVIKGKKQYRTIKKTEEWIYPATIDFLEMYNGILLAADTLRTLGLDVNIHAFDITRDTAETVRLIKEGKLAGMDLIIGPVFTQNLKIVSEYARSLGIPVVSPLSQNTSVLEGNPNLFNITPSLGVAQVEIAKKIAENYNDNIVFVHTDSAGVDKDTQRFRRLISDELSLKPVTNPRFNDLLFYSRAVYGNDSINRLARSLSEEGENLIVIASDDPPVASEILTAAQDLSRKYNIRVFGYPSLMYIENLPPELFFDLNMQIFSPYWINYEKEIVKYFDRSYRKKFLTMPLDNSLSWLGFDVAYYFISGLAMHGKAFLSDPGMHNPELLQNDFNFFRAGEGWGLENRKLFVLRYTKDYEIRPEQ